MKNAYIGYSYQNHVTSLFIAKMDIEREIDSIEIEADTNNNFDDIIILSKSEQHYFQIKDFANISLKTVTLSADSILINGKNHKLSEGTNIIFFKDAEITANTNIWGLPAQQLGRVYIISLNREKIDNKISELYNSNQKREFEIRKFLSRCLDNRKLLIERKDLPIIDVFNTDLPETSVDIGLRSLDVKKVLIIEGKPGVGKSHLVSWLEKEFTDNILYRFWISNQDKDRDERLKFQNFILDISKKLFNDQNLRSEDDLINKLSENQKIVIIDGLDHVENYNNIELQKYIQFITKLESKCKTIVLTRPLQYKLTWDKYELLNWNREQTEKVLNEIFHIDNYDTVSNIYKITEGYPILVKYLAEHYKKHQEIPSISVLKTVDDYYDTLFGENVKIKSAFNLFLCGHSFYMNSEIQLFLNDELAAIIDEFVNAYPYLFEKRLNRISLLHDSLNTYLRKQNLNYTSLLKKVNEVVYKSIINQETKFLSRFSFFDLDLEMRKEIIVKYSSISVFNNVIKTVIDFEAIQSFYFSIREGLLIGA